MRSVDHNMIFFAGETKTEGSSEPVPLTGLARDVLHRWKQEQGSTSPFLFPSPVKRDQPITSVKTAWKTTLRKAGVAYFPIYHLRHVFTTGDGGAGAAES
jgi:integrase